ncbi:hypothetical protein LTR62_006340 [Meristemomyces frigidus]|uniref:Zn(2)-C6 fungal-type domain-containing protein n=1 Tax=Meristemomyces frigidus TaxID=1508187 RepID=A0AAN7TDJ2_9PEZI|nr:hypothetical protein LTR62_006340 [Meristemomyces frigidus]
MGVDSTMNDAVPDAQMSRSMARSCTTCSKAKAKCVRLSGREICDRCARLSKTCTSKEPVTRKRKSLKSSRAAQLAKLESKIEHLVNTLSTYPSTLNTTGNPSPPLSQHDFDNDSGRRRRDEILATLCADHDECDDAEGRSSTSTSSPTECDVAGTNFRVPMVPPNDKKVYDMLGMPVSEAEILLDRYKRLMAPSLPFVLIAPDVTAQQMREQKPLLLHAIVTVTCFHDLAKQQALVRTLMRDITERILMTNEKNIGVVQALLVFVAWYHPHIFWGQQVNNLLHLAIAMTNDLGIDRAPGTCPSDFKAATSKAVQDPAPITKSVTMEEIRALSGVYYLTSMLASSFQKLDPVSWTSFLDKSLMTLAETREHESDLLLVQLMRLQHLAQDTQTTGSSSAPVQMYVKSFTTELAALRQHDPCAGSANTLLELQYLTTEILIWELSLTDLQENKSTAQRTHIDGLYSCISAIKRYMAVINALPINAYLTLPFSIFGQFAHAFIVLTKIAALEDIQGWDMATLHQSLDFAATVEQAALRFDAATTSSPDGLRVDNECFAKWAHRIRWMCRVYQAKFSPSTAAAISTTTANPQSVMRQSSKDHGHLLNGDLVGQVEAGAYQQTQQGQMVPQLPTPSSDELLPPDFINYLDNDFWSNFPVEYDLGFPESQGLGTSLGFGGGV